MGIEVREVSSPRQLRQFIKYPIRLYAGDRHFVPHLLFERKRFFGAKNPVFDFTDVRYFLAYDPGGRIVGRVSAHVNRRANEFHGEQAGCFGFFECVEHPEAAGALLRTAEEWSRGRGMSVIRGPLNFSTNEECGFLVDGFDEPPVLMMPYTKPYYVRLMDECGYRKARDLLAYDYHYPGRIPEHMSRFCERVAGRYRVRVRALDVAHFAEDVRRAFSVYNRAWAKNWGFVPMSEAQFDHMAREMKGVLDPDLAIIAEIDGEPIGFSLSLPNYNVLFKRMKGRLFPFGLFIFLLGRRRLTHLRTLTMGVVPEHRKRGIEMLLIYHTFKNGLPKGYRRAELSWVLEDNVLFRRTAERMGAVPYKTYRIYEKNL